MLNTNQTATTLYRTIETRGGAGAVTREIKRRVRSYNQAQKSKSIAGALQKKIQDSDTLTDPENLENLRSTVKNVFEGYAGISVDNMAGAITGLQNAFSLTNRQAQSLFRTVNRGNVSDITDAIDRLNTITERTVTNSRTMLSRHLEAIDHRTWDADIDAMGNSMNDFGQQIVTAGERLTQFNNQTQETMGSISSLRPRVINLGEGFTMAASSIMAGVQAFFTFKSLVEGWDSGTVGVADIIAGFISLIPVILTIVQLVQHLGTRVKILGTTMTMSMGWFTIAVAGIAALITGIIYLATKETEAEKKARKAAEAAESMKSAAEEAKKVFEDLNNAFNTYDTAVEKLNDCRKGTEEWNQALKEVNNTVLDILKNNPELAKSADLFSRDKYGALIVNEEERDRILEQAERRAVKLQKT